MLVLNIMKGCWDEGPVLELSKEELLITVWWRVSFRRTWESIGSEETRWRRYKKAKFDLTIFAVTIRKRENWKKKFNFYGEKEFYLYYFEVNILHCYWMEFSHFEFLEFEVDNPWRYFPLIKLNKTKTIRCLNQSLWIKGKENGMLPLKKNLN